MPDDAAQGFDTAEIGYFEAELKSLRDAATTLNEAEQPPMTPPARPDVVTSERRQVHHPPLVGVCRTGPAKNRTAWSGRQCRS